MASSSASPPRSSRRSSPSPSLARSPTGSLCWRPLRCCAGRIASPPARKRTDMLALQHIGKTYPNGVHALANVSLDIELGEIVVIVGGSGCGKSTLLRAVSGLDQPTQGRVVLDGSAVTEPNEKIGIVFQESRLLPWLSVAGNVDFGLEHRPRQERDERVAAQLARVGLTEKASVWPRELSGGQAQRVALARALV